MKKINLLFPILSLTTIGSSISVFATSCSKRVDVVIPVGCLKIEGHTLKGLKEDVDVSQYNTLSIPNHIKIIDDNAFNNVFAVGTKQEKIDKIVIPSSVREIRKGSFSDCTSIRTLDLSSWGVDEIYYYTIAADAEDYLGAFSRWAYVGNVIFKDGISDETKNLLSKKLFNAGLYFNWFTNETTGKITSIEEKHKSGKIGKADFKFHLTEKLPEDSLLYATITKTNSTENIGVATWSQFSTSGIVLFPEENNDVILPVTLINHLSPNEYAEFDITFGLITTDPIHRFKPVWKETLTGFKLTNSTKVATSIEASINQNELKVGETAKITTTVGPKDIEDKTVSFFSLNPQLAEVDAEGTVKAIAGGKAKILIEANAGILLYKTIELTIKN